jgi:hypothetical protein
MNNRAPQKYTLEQENETDGLKYLPKPLLKHLRDSWHCICEQPLSKRVFLLPLGKLFKRTYQPVVGQLISPIIKHKNLLL